MNLVGKVLLASLTTSLTCFDLEEMEQQQQPKEEKGPPSPPSPPPEKDPDQSQGGRSSSSSGHNPLFWFWQLMALALPGWTSSTSSSSWFRRRHHHHQPFRNCSSPHVVQEFWLRKSRPGNGGGGEDIDMQEQQASASPREPEPFFIPDDWIMTHRDEGMVESLLSSPPPEDELKKVRIIDDLMMRSLLTKPMANWPLTESEIFENFPPALAEEGHHPEDFFII